MLNGLHAGSGDPTHRQQDSEQQPFEQWHFEPSDLLLAVTFPDNSEANTWCCSIGSLAGVALSA